MIRVCFIKLYEAFEPETLDIEIPEPYYRDDERIEVLFSRKKGEYVGVHGIYVYRYEKEEQTEEGSHAYSGVQGFKKGDKKAELLVPTFIRDGKLRFLNIPFKKSRIQVFDITGRRVYDNMMEGKAIIPFDRGSGSYILIIQDVETGKEIKRKLIKLR